MPYLVCEVNFDAALEIDFSRRGNDLILSTRSIPSVSLKEQRMSFYSPIYRSPSRQGGGGGMFAPIWNALNLVRRSLSNEQHAAFEVLRENHPNKRFHPLEAPPTKKDPINPSSFTKISFPDHYEIALPSDEDPCVLRLVHPDSKTGLIGIHGLDVMDYKDPEGYSQEKPFYAGTAPVWIRPDGLYPQTWLATRELAVAMEKSLERAKRRGTHGLNFPRDSGYEDYLQQLEPRLLSHAAPNPPSQPHSTGPQLELL